MKHENDVSLLNRCVAGDREAWTMLARRHAARVRGVVAEVLSTLPRSVAVGLDADQLTTEVFATLLNDDGRRLRNVGPTGDVGAWLTLIARRLTLKHTRRSMRLRKASGLQDTLLKDEDEGRLFREVVREELDDLPARDRLIVELFFFEQTRSEDIAAHLELEPAQVRAYLSEILERLRTRLKAPH